MPSPMGLPAWTPIRARVKLDAGEIAQAKGYVSLIEIAGNPALTGFQAPKILWLRNHEPQHYARLAQVLLPKDYVRLRLTGRTATDLSDASGTLLLDVAGRRWSAEVLAALDLDPGWLPELHEGPQATGEHDGVPVAAGAGDQAAGAIGVGVTPHGCRRNSAANSGLGSTSNPRQPCR